MSSSKATKRRAVGYVRVSRVNGRDKLDGDSFIATKVQRADVAGVADARNLDVVEWFEDLDESGGKDNRPGFQSALELVEAGRADVIVVAKLSRFARSVPGMYRGLERLEAAGGALIAGDIDVDTTTAMGRMVLTIVGAVVQMELELARENWEVARKVAASSGKFPGSLPLGYRRTKEKRVELDPVIAPAVAELYRGRAEGLPFTALAEAFTRETRRALHPQSVDKIVANRAYLGELKNGELTLKVEPIVTPSEWSAAQSAKAPRPARSKTGSLLAGILRCGTCGRPMSYRGGKVGQYTCQRFANGERCSAPVLVAGAKVDELVERAFLERHADSGAAGEPADRAELAAAERELERARADLHATLALDLGVAGDVLAEVIAEKSAAVEAAEVVLDDLRSSSALDERLENVGERWPELELDERQRLLAAAIASVTVHRVGPGSRVPIEERTSIVFADDAGATTGEDRARA